VGETARVTGLWRHAVKSLQGQPVDSALVDFRGVVGDRAWGVRDVRSGTIVSAKRDPDLLLVTAQVSGEGVTVTVPGQAAAHGRAADAALSAFLGRPVVIDMAPPTGPAYVDAADLHVLSAAEVGAWDVRRFRPNVVVDWPGSLDGLVGERIRLGTVVADVTKRTRRCAMPTARQPGVPKDVGVLRTIARQRDMCLGVYAQVAHGGVVHVGDVLTTT
jgi:uncharacterized protein YcbX